jgi:hypothetical protein
VEAWRLLASIETQRGHYLAARSAMVEAGRHAHAHGAHPRLAHVTHALLAFDEWPMVQRLVCEADWSRADIARQAPALAQHLLLAGDDAGAARFCSTMRRRIQPDARLEYVAGLAARNTGDADGAEAAFERSIEIHPAFAPAHWSLAYHRPAGVRRLRRLVDALQRVGATSDEAVELRYALYRENEAAGNADDAWRWLADATARKATALGAAAASAHEARRFHTRPLPGEPRDRRPIVFIVGLPRTGTTVLERMLGNHPSIHAAGELNAFHAALCMAEDRFLPMPATTRDLPAVTDPQAVGRHYRDAIAHMAGSDRVVVDKNPANFLYSALIADAMPEARILCLHRDPMDACFSNLKELFPGDAYPYSYSFDALAAQSDWFERMRLAFEDALPQRFMSVSYEAMVADPRSMADRVFAFCGLDYHDGAERIERNTAPVSTASSTQVREPVHARGVGAWRRYATQLEPLRRELVERGLAV